MLKKGIFITGTDTDVGKTIVSALFLSCLNDHARARYFKPVQTGDVSDTETVLQITKLKSENTIPPIYTFKAPLSPDRAAAIENTSVNFDHLLNAFYEIRSSYNENEFLVVEGAGGLEVPLNDQKRFSDLMVQFNLPLVLVASTRLGTINHTLLSVKQIKSMGVPFLGVVLNGAPDPGLREVLEAHGTKVLFEIPQIESLASGWGELKNQFSQTILDLVNTRSGLHQSREHEVVALDKKNIWHPYTQHGAALDFPVVKSALGSEIFFENGKSVIDGISSWWVNMHGHSEPYIAQAIANQAQRLEHVIFAGYTHEPAVTLAERLLKETQKVAPKIEKVFYSDNGSTAVEVAMKMAYQAQKQKGQTKRLKFLALKGSYHGDTLAAMSASDRDGFHKIFTPLMAPVDFIEPDDFSELEKVAGSLEDYAACIVEPLVQGAGGMRFYSSAYLKKLADLCREKGVYLIADEVFTGFFRTGTFLASEQASIEPDLICLSKGITGGFLPLAVTLTTQEIFQTFHSDSLEKAFLHGHSYTANPIACAAANASMDLLLSAQGQKRIGDLKQNTAKNLSRLTPFKGLKNLRQLGTIAAFDVDSYKGYFSGDFSRQFSRRCQEQGVLLRPLGGTVYTLPPYCTTQAQVDLIFNVIIESLKVLEVQ